MTTADLPHRRYNPLSDRWVLVSPHRTRRPWQGAEESPPPAVPAHDPGCYLCPGNSRASGAINPDYAGVYVFDNDFPAVLAGDSTTGAQPDPLLRAQPVRGRCRVICYSPRHNLSLGDLPGADIEAVIQAWSDESRRLHDDFAWVQVFENRGAAMGSSNPHPHGQVWALDYLPGEAVLEDRQQRQYFEAQRRPLLLDYAEREVRAGERVVLQNEHWLAVVPWWATWPFETLVLPRHRLASLVQIGPECRAALAHLLGGLITGFDRLFGVPFPYSLGWHGAPRGEPLDYWQVHAHFYPPLLRSATVRKHMVGFEMFAEAQRDITPEQAAARLRDLIPTPRNAGAEVSSTTTLS